MRKIFTTLTMAIVCLAFGMQAYAAETVYLKNTKNWAQPCVWAWNDSENCTASGDWPGDNMTLNDETNLWEWTAPEGKVPTKILFCNRENPDETKTNNLSFENNAIYDCTGKIDGKEYVVYFYNIRDWSKPSVWAWNGDGDVHESAWPGDAMNYNETTGLWEWRVPESKGLPANLVFTNGENYPTTQTYDCVYNNCAVYTIKDGAEVSENKIAGAIMGQYNYAEHTVYFNNNDGWNTLKVYSSTKYDGGEKAWTGGFPGSELTTQGKWGVYEYTFTSFVDPTIVLFDGKKFEDGAESDKQTDDYVFASGALYNSSSKVQDTYTAPEAITVKYLDEAGWEKVYVHYWGGNVSSAWPGAEMTLEQPSAVNGMLLAENENKVYTAEIPANSTGIVFSNGTIEAKTPDITNIEDNATYNLSGETTGVEDILAEDGVREYYNLNGLKVAEENLTPGCYIVRCGNKVQKVFVR